MKQIVVYHPEYGQGVVKDKRRAGVEWLVHFDSGEERWVRNDLLEIEDDSPPLVPARRSGEPQKHLTERKVIEALRMGIVPDDGLDLFTVGCEPQIAELQTWLATPDEPGRLVIGTYGTGKTHLLNHFRHVAQMNHYAVSLVEMDPQETPFSRPKLVYAQIARNLRWPDGAELADFRQLVRRAFEHGLLRGHPYFRWLTEVADQRVWDWIAGLSGTRPGTDRDAFDDFPALYDTTTAANIYCYLLSTLSWLCHQPALHLKGLLVLFDESEALYAARGQLAVDRAVNFIDAMIRTAEGDEELTKDPRDTEFTISGHADRTPFLYRSPSGLKLVFAFTWPPDHATSHCLAALPQIKLEPADEGFLETIQLKLWGVYRQAYGERAATMDQNRYIELLRECTFSNTRAIVKGAVEALDIVRFGTDEGGDVD